jgi:hypothetical protein
MGQPSSKYYSQNRVSNVFGSKQVRPRSIPWEIWVKIRDIAKELGMDIPSTLEYLAELYKKVKRAGP